LCQNFLSCNPQTGPVELKRQFHAIAVFRNRDLVFPGGFPACAVSADLWPIACVAIVIMELHPDGDIVTLPAADPECVPGRHVDGWLVFRKQGQVENAIAAMDFARFAPKRLYAKMSRRDFGGELCSFFFAFTGDFLAGVDHFLGAEIRDGLHVAPVPPSPGSCVAVSLRGGRLGATHAYQRGVFSGSELVIFRDQLQSDLRG